MLSKLRKIKWPGNSKADDKSATEPVESAKSSSGTPSATVKAKANGKHGVSKSADSGGDTDHDADLNSTSEKIRLRACGRIKDPARLLTVALNDGSENVRLAAARQYARVLPADDNAKKTFDEFNSNADKRHLARLITAHNNDSALRGYGVSQYSHDDDLFHIATETRFHDTRQSVTTSLQSLDLVDQCYRAIKSKDKVVARELKKRLNQRQAENELFTRQTEEVDKIVEEMSRLAHGAWSPTYPNRYELFASRWQAIDFEIDVAKKQQFDELNAIAAEKVARNLAEQEKQNSSRSIVSEMESLLAQLQSTELVQLPEKLTDVKAREKALHRNWNELQTHAAIEKSLDQQYTRLAKTLSNELKNANITLRAYQTMQTDAKNDTHKGSGGDFNHSSDNDSGNGSGRSTGRDARSLGKQLSQLQDLKTQLANGAAPSAYSRDLPRLIESVQHTITRSKQQDRELKASINKQFGSLNSAISANRWGPARSVHERLSKKIARLGASDQKHYAEKLERLEKKLNDLGDWKQFATDPKLETLCEQMEQVPALGLSPKDQADRIKDLQQQWKAMGASPGQEIHWPRFKQAADIAFEPCAKYFEARRNEKDGKLKQRAEICDMLQNYLDKSDWDNSDWKLVEKTVRTAKNEWRKTRVFDRKAGAELEARFTKILADIDEKLQPAYDAGAAEKTDLIAKAKVLGEGEINQHCMNQLKRLQSMWKRTGLTRRKDDQKLWAEFNDVCSKLYQTHRGQQREQYAASMEHVTRARQIIGELKAVSKNDATPDEKQLQQLQDEFAALAEFPEKDHKYIMRDFTRALDSVENHRLKMTDVAQQNELQRLAQNADICANLENLAGQSDAIEATIESLLAEWDNGEKTDNPRWKKAMLKRRETILAQLASASLPNFDSNTEARRLLCIETEILNDCETPDSDKNLRMQYQLDRLQKGLTSGNAESPQQQLLNLKIRWLTSLPAERNLRESLDQRFNTAVTSKPGKKRN